MLHRLAALAVTCATFPARTHEPAARPAPGSHAWIIRQDASAPAGHGRVRIRRPVLAAVCTQAPTGGGQRRQRSRPAVTDENRRPARCGAGDHLGLARAIRRPRRNSAGQVGDAHLVAAPANYRRDGRTVAPGAGLPNRALRLLSCRLCQARAEQVDLDARSPGPGRAGPGHRAGPG